MKVIKIKFNVHDLGVIEALKMHSKEMENWQKGQGRCPDFDIHASAYAFMKDGIELYLEQQGLELRMNCQKGEYEIVQK